MKAGDDVVGQIVVTDVITELLTEVIGDGQLVCAAGHPVTVV